MIKKKQISLSFAILVCIFLSSAFLFTFGYNEIIKIKIASTASTADIHTDIQEKMDKGKDSVEAILLLEEKANTAKVSRAVREHARPFASGEQIKTMSCRAVVTSLQNTAEKTQEPILDYLQSEKKKNKVDKIKEFFIVNAIYVKADSTVIEALSHDSAVDKIIPNLSFKLQQEEISTDKTSPTDVQPSEDNLEWGIERINAHRVWNEFDIDGEGVVIGILDTGVTWEHEALKEKWRGYCPDDNHDPTYSWYDAKYGKSMPVDVSEHGTHVAGTAVGADPDGNNKIGVAPGSQWIAANAFNNNESATYSDLIEAGEYLLAPGGNPDKSPDIITNAWGGPWRDNPIFREVIQRWRDAGIFPVVAAGNTRNGAHKGSILLPGIYPESITVGATNSNNRRTDWSNRGPAKYYPEELKPNISAPGNNIRSATKGIAGYDNKSGTSMATPHVAGAAALLLSYDPGLSVEEIEETLFSTATPRTDSDYDEYPNYGYGYGIVNAATAIDSLHYEITIEDDVLEKAIRQNLGKENNKGYLEYTLTRIDMEQLEELDLSGKNIESLAGLEYAINLEYLYLGEDKPVPVIMTYLEIASDNIYVSTNETDKEEIIKLNVIPGNADIHDITWLSNDPSMAEVADFEGDNKSTIYPRATGSTEIINKVKSVNLEGKESIHETTCKIEVVKYGDVTGNGNIKVADAINILRHVVEIHKLEGCYKKAALVAYNNDGNVSSKDALTILRYLVGREEVLPAGTN